MDSCKQLIILADKLPNTIRNKEVNFRTEILPHMKGINLLYTSLLPGPELMAAKLAKSLAIPYVATIPFEEYSNYWPQRYRNAYKHYLKKSIKKIHVDRQPGYISSWSLPGKHSYEKLEQQTRWSLNRINLHEAPTKILLYGKPFFGPKRELVMYYLSTIDPDKWTIVEKIFSFPQSLPFTDELPF